MSEGTIATLVVRLEAMSKGFAPEFEKAGGAMDDFAERGAAAEATAIGVGNSVERLTPVAAAAGASLETLAGSLEHTGSGGELAARGLRVLASHIGILAGAVAAALNIRRLVLVLRALGITSRSSAFSSLVLSGSLWKYFTVANLSSVSTYILNTVMSKLTTTMVLTAVAASTAAASLYLWYIGMSLGIGLVVALVGAALALVAALAAAAAAAVLAAASFAAMTSLTIVAVVAKLAASGMEYAETMREAAAATGATVAAMSRMDYVARHLGSSSQALVDGLGSMVNRIDELEEGSEAAVAMFAKIGLSVADLAGLSVEERFARIAAAIEALPTKAERAAAAFGIFGRSASDLSPLLLGGEAAAKALAEEADAIGLSLSEIDAANITAAQGSLSKLSDVVEGIGAKIAAVLAPYIDFVASGILRWAKSSDVARNAALLVRNSLIEGARIAGKAWDAARIAMSYIIPAAATVSARLVVLFQWVAGWAVRALQALAAVASVASSVAGAAIRSASDEIQKQMTAIELVWNALQKGSKSGDGTGGDWAKTIQDVGAAAEDAARNLEIYNQKRKRLGEIAVERSERAKQILNELREQDETFGLDEFEKKLRELKKYIPKEDFASVLDAEASIRSLRKKAAEQKAEQERLKGIADEQERLNKLAEDYTKKVRTPAEKYRDEIKQLEQLRLIGKITAEQFERAKKQAQGAFLSDIKFDPTRAAGATEKGSREAYSAIRLFNAPKTLEAQQVKKLDEIKGEQKQANGHLKRIADAKPAALKARR